MKPYINRIIIYNRAPFDSIDLSFSENGVYVLTGINGQGKTTLISYIIDSWYELIRNHYRYEFKGDEGTYYRISSSLFVPDHTKPSIVYIRYIVDGRNVDSINIEAGTTEEQYNELVPLAGKIPFDRVSDKNGRSKRGKFVSENVKEEMVLSWLNSNVLTCFPSFRYEMPYYMTDFFKTKFEFKKDDFFSGYLTNPLLVVSGIDGVTNWLMDLVLDLELYDKQSVVKQETILWRNVNNVLSSALSSKIKGVPVRFGLGRRNRGASRISVVRTDNSELVYPSIFGMSSGELAIISMFLEILRQADNLTTNIPISDIKGIVLVDEIDKHLHIKLQKELLPSMLALFPNIQFIISTHSPFLTMGLAENGPVNERTKIVDFDQGGLVSEPESVDIYREVYDMMISQNDNYKLLYDELQRQIRSSAIPLVITEGKTDAKHIKNALLKLGITDLNVDFFEIGQQEWGDSKLESMLESFAKVHNQRKIIGIFDRDSDKYVTYATSEGMDYRCLRQGSNVYIFCIPLVNQDEYGSAISIEHYYHREDLLKENDEHRRLFLGDEFYENGNSKDGSYQTRIKNIQHKVRVNGIIDEKVYRTDDLQHLNSVALSKDAFAELVCGDTNYAINFDLSSFESIISVLRDICAL